MYRSEKLLDSAGRVTIVRGNSVTLMEQVSFVTAVTVRIRVAWIAYRSPGGRTSARTQSGHARVGTPCTPCINSADGYIYNTRYSVPWSECVHPDSEITSPLLDVTKVTYVREDSR